MYAPRGLPGYDKYTERVESMLFVLKSRLREEGGACRGGFRGGIPDGGVYAGVVGRGEIMASNRGEVLVEHSFVGPSNYVDDILFGLQGRGFCPVLAHRNGIRFTRRILSGIVSGLKKKVERCR